MSEYDLFQILIGVIASKIIWEIIEFIVDKEIPPNPNVGRDEDLHPEERATLIIIEIINNRTQREVVKTLIAFIGLATVTYMMNKDIIPYEHFWKAMGVFLQLGSVLMSKLVFLESRLV